MFNKKTILIISLALLLPLTAGAKCISLEGSEFAQYIQQGFTWSLRIAGLIVFAALIFGGFMYLISGGNQSRIEQGKSYMTGAVLGLVILLGSVLLLRTINPQLLERFEEPDPPEQGICFYGEKSGTSTRCCYTDSSKSMPENFEAEEADIQSSEDNLRAVYWFESEDWQGSCKFINNEDEGTEGENVTGIQSFFMDWQRPGVYLFKDSSGGTLDSSGLNYCEKHDFPNYPYKRVQKSTSDLGGYKGEVRQVDFRDLGCKDYGGTEIPEITYAAVLHNQTNHEGRCKLVGVENNPENLCDFRSTGSLEGTTESGAESITVFNYNYPAETSAVDLSGSVTFYEKVGQKGDRFTIEASEIQSAENFFWSEEVNYPFDNLGGAEVIPGPTTLGESGGDPEMDRILSMKIDGNFMVFLGSDTGAGDRYAFQKRCEVRKESVPDFIGHHVLDYPADDQINAIGIAPVRSAAD